VQFRARPRTAASFTDRRLDAQSAVIQRFFGTEFVRDTRGALSQAKGSWSGSHIG